MTHLKLLSNAVLVAIIGIVTILSTAARHFSFINTHYDTTYTASTQQIRSNNIPDSVLQLTELRHLSITGMDCDNGDMNNCWMINEIPSGIKNLKKLTSLHLTLNAIRIIPDDLSHLRNLTLIDLTDNLALTNIDNLTKLVGLEYLSLNGCGLTKLPENIGDLKKLKLLGLAGNRFGQAEQTRIKQALPNCTIKF